MKELAFIVECIQDASHKIPLVIKVSGKENMSKEAIEVECPICGTWNSFIPDQQPGRDTTLIRGEE